MKVAFDADSLGRRPSLSETVEEVAKLGFRYLHQACHPRMNPPYLHPLFPASFEQEYRRLLKEYDLEISSFAVTQRWAGPNEELRQLAVENWKAIIELADRMGVSVLTTELEGDPAQKELCNGLWFRSVETLLPIAEDRGIRIDILPKPCDFVGNLQEVYDMVQSFRSPNLCCVYSFPVDEPDLAKQSFLERDIHEDMRRAGDFLSHLKVDLPLHCDRTATNLIFSTLREMDFPEKEFEAGEEGIVTLSIKDFDEESVEELRQMKKWVESGLEMGGENSSI